MLGEGNLSCYDTFTHRYICKLLDIDVSMASPEVFSIAPDFLLKIGLQCHDRASVTLRFFYTMHIISHHIVKRSQEVETSSQLDQLSNIPICLSRHFIIPHVQPSTLLFGVLHVGHLLSFQRKFSRASGSDRLRC